MKSKGNQIKTKFTTTANLTNIHSPTLLKSQVPLFNTTQKILNSYNDKIQFKEIQKSSNKSHNEINLDNKSSLPEKPINIVKININKRKKFFNKN